MDGLLSQTHLLILELLEVVGDFSIFLLFTSAQVKRGCLPLCLISIVIAIGQIILVNAIEKLEALRTILNVVHLLVFLIGFVIRLLFPH